MAKRNSIIVEGTEINITSLKEEDYISLTDMAGSKDDDSRAADVIKNWIRNRSTIEFLGTWESLYNKDFKVVEFDHFRKEAGLPTFTMSVSNWVESTNAKGIFSVKGRYGGTYAHRDIAFEFGSAISPIFKLHIIKEYQRLKEIETDKYGLEWDVRRILSKTNYKIHTDAVKKHIIPKTRYSAAKEWLEYADEADLLNIALFGCTAKQWRELNPTKVLNGENIRDMASINELAILSNLESLSSTLINNNITKKNRLKILIDTVREQRETLDKIDIIKSLKKNSNRTFIDAKRKLKE
ncbi:KilA-N domain-containing protein [Subsaximicrobium wynnwilliamsii]|uniref:KilA-N domain-containing protein n=1 Tax=Subsaximicrobium wynnwilliamsii TaxID=291179 RepID=A0A5C6ZE84_9FLAO|nr:KilA-N domain-containing protein [Subsaximicrobium wynnwilliamsii]TXD82223.1 KilA-N domain-containing protein [Subsaximicrobium wynnwilliamsii]TXD87863.1 KilA-N domain-containing protein [Subsaximicrobium wynnwilliamsii]TXE01813.1 KilA-N domain-containing protein [Subsaximicrobium wynnwilliamsii]